MARLRVGDVVHAIVVSVQPFGIYLQHRDSQILVFVYETTWIDGQVSDCREFTQVGDEFQVKVVRIDEETDTYFGSIRQAHPEDDPWRDAANTFRPGTRWRGTVVHEIFDQSEVVAYVVQIVEGVKGVALWNVTQQPLTPGQATDVTVIDIQPERREMQLKLI